MFQSFTPSLGEYAFNSEVGVLSQPVYDAEKAKRVGFWLIEIIEREEEPEGAYIQAILLGSDDEVREVKARVEAGEDFGTLAKELSQFIGAKENGGDLGLILANQSTEALNAAIFNNNLETGILSEPVRDEMMATKGGYWLVKVLDKADDRLIDETDQELLKTKALSDWILALLDDPQNDVEIYLDDTQKTWAIGRVGR